MKKFFAFFVFVAGLILAATSCNHPTNVQPSVKISVSMDTTVYQKIPVTSPLYSCETGKRRPYDKLLAVDSIPVNVSLKKDTVISGKNLTPVPPAKHAKKSGAEFNLDWLWPILGFLLGALLIILALALLCYVLFWLFRLFANQTRGNNPPVGPGIHPVAPAPQIPGNSEQNQQPPTPNQPNQTDIFNHQLSMAETLIGNQRIHRIVQRADGTADGSWQSEIIVETKNDPPTQPKE